MSNAYDKQSLLDSFSEEVNSYLPEIEANLERLAQSPGDMEALEETHRRTHTIGGSASMMDFPGLAHVAHGMEDILSDVQDGLTVLDEPTLSLLRRSLARVRRLLNGIREGQKDTKKEEAIIAEDDADYEQYRTVLATSLQQQPASAIVADLSGNAMAGAFFQAPATPSFGPVETATNMPSFDEVLASFRTPAVSSSEDVGWPEEAMLSSSVPMPGQPQAAAMSAPVQDIRVEQLTTPQFQGMQPSALDELVASTRKTPSAKLPPAMPPTPLSPPAAYDLADLAGRNDNQVSNGLYPVPSYPAVPERHVPVSAPSALPSVFTETQQRMQTVEAQMESLKNVVSQLRSAMTVIEEQRAEFKGFLDRPKDALELMVDWAGRAMGLNLRNSPEQVRRYLPLSVMWVSNTKLKKVLELLHQVTNGVNATDEQIQVALEQLQTAITSCGDAFQELSARAVLTQEPGWTSWEMQVTNRNAPHTVRESVTFERHGDLQAIRAEIEAQLREEMRREYEARPISLAARAELEQQIRAEVRQEFESRRQLQTRVAGPEEKETRQELEARVRDEIEIQVRQEFLDMIARNTGEAGTQPASGAQTPAASTTSNYLDRVSEGLSSGAGLTPSASQPLAQSASITNVEMPQGQSALPSQSRISTTPSKPSSPQNFTGDLGEEAAEIFKLEAEEHLQSISLNAAALEKAPTNREHIQGIRRATHTLKGAAGMMGFRAISDLCHVSEDLLDRIMEDEVAISPAMLSIILDTVETLDQLINSNKMDSAADEARVQALRVRYKTLLGNGDAATAGRAGQEDQSDPLFMAGVIVDEEVEVQRTAPGDLNVRVRLQRLDELVNLFGELLVNRSVLEERIQRLIRAVADVGLSSTRLRDVGQKLESNFEAATLPSGRSIQVMPGEGEQRAKGANGLKNGKVSNQPAHLAEFDELELDRYTEFHRLARGLSEGISDMTTLSTEMEAIIRECESVFARENRLSTTFQDRLMKVRLVPLSTMAPRLYRAARAVALKQGKDFEFLLEGEETEVDRSVYEEIAGPLLHLMRNAVNHAIETPEVRIQRGKPPVGQIKFSASYEGNQVVITVRDDGTGINPESVRNTAIARGLIRPDQILSENDLIELIFRPGFSTAEFLSEESGRGVGLDVVRDSVSRLRGAIEVESTPGKGTAFTMRFPTSMAIQSAMMVRVADQTFAVPAVMVESIGRLDNYKRTTVAGQPAVVGRNEVYPLYTLAQYLSLPVGQLDEKSQLLFINTGGQRVALVAEEIKGKLDIVMKNLGPHLRHVNGIAGATVLGNGQVVLVLELTELLSARMKPGIVPTRQSAVAPKVQAQTPVVPVEEVFSERQTPAPVGGRVPAPTALPAGGSERGKYVLVVDDSPSVRRVVGNMLKQNNWEVQMARDGVEALEVIAGETPAAVLLDIEMPRMDGYELIATVRAQEQYRTLPLVVLTSRAASKHQQRAMQLGASAYVIKPYQDEELLNLLKSLVYGAAVRM